MLLRSNLPRHARAALLARLLVTFALAGLVATCDDDGTAPPTRFVVPDTMAGTYDVDQLEVPAGTTVRVEADVLVRASGPILIAGEITLAPGVTLALASDESITIEGSIGPAAATPAGAPQDAPGPRRSPQAEDAGTLALAAPRVVVAEGVEIETHDLFIAGLGEGATVDFIGENLPGPGVPATARNETGGKGGSVVIGSVAALDAVAARGIDDAVAPASIVVKGLLQGGFGGHGYVDVEGTRDGDGLTFIGSDGGAGGDVELVATERIDFSDGSVNGGNGGAAGGCGAPETGTRGLDGGPGEPGEDVLCITGDGGAGGDVVLSAPEVIGIAHGGFGGQGPAVLVSGGNGGAGARGGNTEIQLGRPGVSGTPVTDVSEGPSVVAVFNGGNGGNATSPDEPGGAGGSVRIVDRETAGPAQSVTIHLGTVQADSYQSRGGNGFDGCTTTPGARGSDGGPAGTLYVVGAEYIVEVPSFNGGDGGDGIEAGAGGEQGYDDAGEPIGADGFAGTACPQLALPVVTGVTPNPVAAEIEDDIDMVVDGSFFDVLDAVSIGGTPVETEFVSETQLEATVPADLIGYGVNELTVDKPGVGTSDPFELIRLYPAPSGLVLSRDAVAVGDPDPVVRIEGNGLIEGVTQVTQNGEPREVDFGDGWMDVLLDVWDAQNIEIDVSNDVPDGQGGGAAEPLPLAILYQPVTVTSIEPGRITIGDCDGRPVVIEGAYMGAGTTLLHGDDAVPGGAVSGSRFEFSLSGDMCGATGPLVLVLSNPGDLNTDVQLDVVPPSPVITSIEPAEIGAGLPSFPLVIEGTGFGEWTRVEADDHELDVLDLACTEGTCTLESEVPAELFGSPHEMKIEVVNPDADADTTAISHIIVRSLAPTLTSIEPDEIEVPFGDIPLTVNGSAFQDDAVVLADGEPLVTTKPGVGVLEATLPASLTNAGGTLDISVRQPDGLEAATPLELSVLNPAPTLDELSPSDAIVGSDALLLTLNGTNFVASSYARFNGETLVPTTYGGPNQMLVTVPAELLDEVGNFTVDVVTPAPGGGTTDGLPFAVVDDSQSCEPLELEYFGELASGQIGAGDCTAEGEPPTDFYSVEVGDWVNWLYIDSDGASIELGDADGWYEGIRVESDGQPDSVPVFAGAPRTHLLRVRALDGAVNPSYTAGLRYDGDGIDVTGCAVAWVLPGAELYSQQLGDGDCVGGAAFTDVLQLYLRAGESVSISVTTSSIDGFAATIELRLDGGVVATDDGDPLTENATLEYTASVEGVYELVIGSEESEFTETLVGEYQLLID